MSSYEARFHSKPKWFSENLKQGPELDSAFENYYSRHTFNVHLIIKRIIHEQLARRFVPVMTDVRVLETLPDVIELVPPSSPRQGQACTMCRILLGCKNGWPRSPNGMGVRTEEFFIA